MPVKRCTSEGQPGYQYGDSGKCYVYIPGNERSRKIARKKAVKQGVAEITSKFFKNEKISLDFDGVLSTNKGQDLASSLKDKGAILYIVTARNSSAKNLDLFKVAELLQIPTNRIIFTNGKDKWKTLKDLEIDTHYDNNQEQIDKIRSNTSVKGILFNG